SWSRARAARSRVSVEASRARMVRRYWCTRTAASDFMVVTTSPRLSADSRRLRTTAPELMVWCPSRRQSLGRSPGDPRDSTDNGACERQQVFAVSFAKRLAAFDARDHLRQRGRELAAQSPFE